MMFALGLSLTALATDALTPIQADQQRIRRHLADVASDLRDRDVHHLGPTERAHRSEALDVLDHYRHAGEFPHNTEVPGTRVPVFRDVDGRDCAVGALIRASGHAALADTIDAGWHLERVPDIAVPELLSWADDHGFTVDELAAIQPSYCMCDDDGEYAPVCGADGMTYWNTCAAETCAGEAVVADGACPYDREICPEFVATEPPAVTACDMAHLCGDEPNVFPHTWQAWLAEQDQACIESTGDLFDGPDDLPEEPDEPDAATGPTEPASCSTGGTAGVLALILVVPAVRRRR